MHTGPRLKALGRGSELWAASRSTSVTMLAPVNHSEMPDARPAVAVARLTFKYFQD